LHNDNPANRCFQDLGIEQIPQQLNDEDLTPVCQVYSSYCLTDIPALQWELFRSKRSTTYPSCQLPHLMRANYMAMRDKTYPFRCPNLPPVEQRGWDVKNGMYIPVICFHSPAPRAVCELTKCGCKSDCNGARCRCFQNALPCTPCASITKGYVTTKPEMSMTLRMTMMMIMSDSDTCSNQRLVISCRLVMV